jgi:hypothetical protein
MRRGRSRSRDRAKDDFNPHLVQVFIPQLDDLFEAFLVNGPPSLFKELVLALDDGASHCPFARVVPFEAFLKGDIEEQGDARHLIPACKVQQVPASLRRERGGIHNAEPVQAQALFDHEMDECEGLGLISLVALVVADAPARPV